MRPLPKAFLIIVLFACVLIAGLLLPRGSRETFMVSAPPAQPASVFSTAAVWPDVFALAARLGAEETMSAIGAELERVHSFVESQIPAVVPWSGSSSVPDALGSRAPNAGGGGLSREQFQALARCESGTDPYAGDPSPWRTGYFGLEAGHPVGGLSLAEQEAEVQRIYANFGSAAWGCPI